ncbi:hypothetical protein ACFWFZ_18620 [Streptomyces sp. NPDC060232]|uniref:hypothetical protein n=1 Tax=Streptomyces sp. NPDC060232 TaxID=3347079 RepID=UPI00365E2895
MSAEGPPDPADEPGIPHTGRPVHWLAGSHRWQSLIAALVAAGAAVVVAIISRPPAPTPPTPTAPPTVADATAGTRVTTLIARQYADPSATPAGVAVYFEGTVSGLDPRWTVVAFVRRANERSGWPVAFAEVDRHRGTWKATVQVPRPRLPLEMAAGVAPYPGDRVQATPEGATPSASPHPTDPATLQGLLEEIRRDGPEAHGVEILTPFRPVPTATP